MRRLDEMIKIDGVEYEDSFGEDLPGKNRNYATAKVDGIEKKLYSSGDKSHPERKYVKFRKFEPITQDDNFKNKEELKFIAYKQFKTRYNPNDPTTFEHKGLLYPLFVGDTGNTKDGIRVGKWYSCGVGELRIPVTSEGIPIEGAPIQVGSKLGNLAYRPGWHLASMPLTRHIGKGKNEYTYTDEKGKEKTSYDYTSTCSQYVWCKVEYSAHFDFTEKARQKPGAATDPKKAYFTNKKDMENGFYHFKTNSNADDEEDWLIADKIKVLEVLTDKEVKEIVGEKAQSRWVADGSDNCKFMADFTQFGKLNESKDYKFKAKVGGFWLQNGIKGWRLCDDDSECEEFESETEPRQRINQMKKDGLIDKDAKVQIVRVKEGVNSMKNNDYDFLMKELKDLTEEMNLKTSYLSDFANSDNTYDIVDEYYDIKEKFLRGEARGEELLDVINNAIDLFDTNSPKEVYKDEYDRMLRGYKLNRKYFVMLCQLAGRIKDTSDAFLEKYSKITESQESNDYGRFYTKYDSFEEAQDSANYTYPEGGYFILKNKELEKYIVVDNKNTAQKMMTSGSYVRVAYVKEHPLADSKALTLDKLMKVLEVGTWVSIFYEGRSCGRVKTIGAGRVEATDIGYSEGLDEVTGDPAYDYWKQFTVDLIEINGEKRIKVSLRSMGD